LQQKQKKNNQMIGQHDTNLKHQVYFLGFVFLFMLFCTGLFTAGVIYTEKAPRQNIRHAAMQKTAANHDLAKHLRLYQTK
jgi:hypothetical protein